MTRLVRTWNSSHLEQKGSMSEEIKKESGGLFTVVNYMFFSSSFTCFFIFSDKIVKIRVKI